MKNIFQIPILFLMLFVSGNIFASSTSCVTMADGEIEVFVTDACSESSSTGKINLVISATIGPWEVSYKKLISGTYVEIQTMNLSSVLNTPLEGQIEDMGGLIPSYYLIEVVDSDCAIAQVEVIVGIADPITITATPAPICQASTGSISPEVTGGTEPYSFEWNNGEIEEELLGLEAGTYTVTVTDEAGCSAVESFVLIENESPITFAENFEMTAPTTCSSSDGWIKTWRPGNISGGMTPYTYLWSNGSTTNSIGPISAGTYTLTVTGADGCSAEKQQELKSLEQIIISYENIKKPCPNANNGYIGISADQPALFECEALNISGDNEYFFELNDLPRGTYCIKIISLQTGCELEKCYTLSDEIIDGPLIVDGTTTNSCPGENSGRIQLNVSGGFSNLDYVSTWDSGYPSNGNLAPGTYNVTVTDYCGTTASKSFTISEFNVNPLLIAAEYPIINGNLNIIHNITGGSGNFSYKWESAPLDGYWTTSIITTKNFVTSKGKKYRFTVTDNITGCTKSVIYDCIINTELLVDFEITSPDGCENRITQLQIEAKILSGNPPYTLKFGNQIIISSSESIKIMVPVNQQSWDTQPFFIELKDDCGHKNSDGISARCFNLCPDNCFKIVLEDTGLGGCAKVSGGNWTAFGWIDHSNFAVKSSCSDQQVREVFNSNQSSTITLTGSGHAKFPNLFFGDVYYPFTIRNQTTGCERNEFIFAKACRSFLKTLSNYFLPGGGGGTVISDPPTTCKDSELEFLFSDYDACTKIYYCKKDGKDVTVDISLKTCSIKCGEFNGKKFYYQMKYCPTGCKYEYLRLDNTFIAECPDCVKKGYAVECMATPTFHDPPTCDDEIKEILIDTVNNTYIVFWNDVDSLNQNQLIGYSFKDSEDISDFNTFSIFGSNITIETIRIDTENNHYILGKNGQQYFQKTDIEGQVQWTISMNEFSVKNVSEGQSGNYKLLGYDTLQNLWLIKSISEDGVILTEQILQLGNTMYQKFLQNNDKIVAYSSTNNIVKILTPSTAPSFSIPSNINITDIKSINDNNFVLAGEYVGMVSLLSKSYNSNNYKNPIFLVYNYNGTLLSVRSADYPNDMTVNGAAIVKREEMVFHGFQYEIINESNPEYSYRDSCAYVHFFSLPDSCSNDDLNLSMESCNLLWLNDSLGASIVLQKITDSIWTNVPNASSPYTPEENGSYRLLLTKEGCNDLTSDAVEVTCIVNEPCDEEPIDITYSQTENKFLYFYKKDGSGQIVKSEWVSPITYMMVDSFITWTCENIVIKDIIVDEQLYVYVIGHDITQTNRTRIIKYNWSTLQIVWSQWVETFIYQSLVPYAVNGNTQLAIAGFNTSNNLWYIKGYHKQTGVNVSQSVQEIKSAPGKLGWGFEWIRFFRENVFSFITVSPTSQAINFESPTNPWVAPLPPMIKVREITRLHNGFIVVGGDFSGTFTIDGVEYTSGTYRSIVFLEINNSGSVVNVKVFKGTKHHVLKTFTTDGYYKLAYAGYNTENVNIGETILLNLDSLAIHPDVCAVVDGGTLSSIQLRNAIKESPQSVVKFYPNPFSKGINLDIDSPQRDKVQITVRNSMGSIMFTTTKEVDAGQNIKYLDEFERLPAGVYLVHLKSSLMDHTTRVIRID